MVGNVRNVIVSILAPPAISYSVPESIARHIPLRLGHGEDMGILIGVGIWLVGAFLVGCWASIRLHRDEHWLQYREQNWPMGLTPFDHARGLRKRWKTWPGELPIAVASSLLWPIVIIVWGTIFVFLAFAQPFALIGRIASKPKKNDTTIYLKKVSRENIL